MSVGKYSTSCDCIVPKHGSSITLQGVDFTHPSTKISAQTSMGPLSQPGTAVCSITAYATDPALATVQTSTVSLIGGSATSDGLHFGELPALPAPKYLTSWSVPMLVNGSNTFASYATLSTSCGLSFYSSYDSQGFAADEPSTIYPSFVHYERSS